MILVFAACGTTEPFVGNRAPVANDDIARVRAGQTVTIDVLANPTDADGDDLELAAVDSHTGGWIVDFDVETGAILFRASPSAGTYENRFTAIDGRETDTAKVTVDVQ